MEYGVSHKVHLLAPSASLCAVEVTLEDGGESVCWAAAHENTGVFLHSWQFSMLWLLWLWNLPLEREWEKHSPGQLEPHSRSLPAWHQNGSRQGLCKKSLTSSGEYFVKVGETTQIYPTLTLTHLYLQPYLSEGWLGFALPVSHPVQSRQSIFLLLSTPWALIFDRVWHCNAHAFPDSWLGKRGSRSGWWGKICWLTHQIPWNMGHQRLPESILWEKRQF